MTVPSLVEQVELLDRAFTAAKIPHAFGGALALAYYATPRSTIDIDVNVFVGADGYASVAAVLAAAGVDTIPDESVVTERGQMRARWGATPIDVFFAYDEIHQAMRAAARTVPFGTTKIPILAPEHLLVAKAVFNRPKDWIDIEQMLIAVEALDLEEVRRWMAHLVGTEDARATRVEELVATVRDA